MSKRELEQKEKTMLSCFRDLFDEPDKIVTEDEIREHMKKYYAEDEIERELDFAAYCGMFYHHSVKPIEGADGEHKYYYYKGNI